MWEVCVCACMSVRVCGGASGGGGGHLAHTRSYTDEKGVLACYHKCVVSHSKAFQMFPSQRHFLEYINLKIYLLIRINYLSKCKKQQDFFLSK